jgi:hypothetical protein
LGFLRAQKTLWGHFLETQQRKTVVACPQPKTLARFILPTLLLLRVCARSYCSSIITMSADAASGVAAAMDVVTASRSVSLVVESREQAEGAGESVCTW